MSVKHVVKIYLNYDWPQSVFDATPEWVKGRLKLFTETTLQSLLQQTSADFDVMVICGQRNQDITRNWDWHPRCVPVWDEGREYLTSQTTDFIAITRHDSDDLMHREAMADLKSKLVKDPSKRVCHVWRKCLLWDQLNQFIAYHYRKSPPFFTHTFPRSMYQDWKLLHGLNYVTHGKSGASTPSAIELSKHMICVVKHPQNISVLRKVNRNEHKVVTSEAIQKGLEEGRAHAYKPEDVAAILADFGISPQALAEYHR